MVSSETRDALAMGRGATAGKAARSGSMGQGESPTLDLPSFLVVGPPRTGTSWLHEVLSEHTNLPDPTKETRFFDLHFDRGLPWYLDHFPSAHKGCPRGEVAPTYFRSAHARDRIAQTLPGVKLVFIFRHPVQRLVSLYRLKRAYGQVSWNLEEALERDPELVESSLYATNLRKWQSKFAKEQLSINLYEDLSSNPQAFVDRLTAFLEIPGFQLQESQLGRVYSTTKMTEPRSFLATRAATAMADWCKARRLDHIVAGVKNSHLMRLFLGGGAPFPEIPTETLNRVRTRMLCEIEELEEILGRDLSHWKTPPSLS
jgi:hypothetical protein